MMINLFADTVLRVRGDKFYLMNHPEKGWSSSCIEFSSPSEVTKKYNVRLGLWMEDKFGKCCMVIRNKE